jgi:TonB family protein
LFESYGGPGGSQGQDLRRRTIALFVTLAIHGLFVYGFIRGRITVKILKVPVRISEVRLAPPVPLKLTGRIEDLISAGPVGGSTRGGTARTPGAGGPGAGGGSEDVPDIDVLLEARRLSRGGAPAFAGESPMTFLSKKFSLSEPKPDRPSRPGSLVLRLAPPPEEPEPPRPIPARRLYPDQGMIDYARRAGARRPGPGTSGAPAAGGQRAAVILPEVGYDISPWAKQIIDLLQLNWDLGAIGDVPPRSEVRVAATVSKSGEVSSLQVISSASLEALDRNALDAVRRCLPFPALPGDFPAESLPAIFVFIYHD